MFTQCNTKSPSVACIKQCIYSATIFLDSPFISFYIGIFTVFPKCVIFRYCRLFVLYGIVNNQDDISTRHVTEHSS